MTSQMTRAQYEEKYRQPIPSSSQPLQMTREQYNQKYNKSVAPTPQKQGFLKNLVMGTGIPRLAANIVNAGPAAMNVGRSLLGQPTIPINNAKPVNMPWLGPVKPVGQEGSFGERIKDTIGESAKLTATILPVGGGATNIARATLAGRIGRGALAGVKAGTTGGALYGLGDSIQQKDATIGSVALSTGMNALIGGVTGGVLGTALPTVSATARGATNLITTNGRAQTASNIMNRVARIHPTDYQKFKKITGEDVGEYLVKRGIYGNDEEITQKLFTESMRSKAIADAELEKLGGNWKSAPIKDALDILLKRETQVSTPNVKSPDFDRVSQLLKKHNTDGLSMTEINQVKRLLESNVKMDYLNTASPNVVGIQQANNLDDSIRTWQFDMAKKLGLENLPEINKNTQATYTLANALYKKLVGQSGNNAIGLGDLVLLSGGDIRGVTMAGARKIFGNKRVQSGIAKAIAPTASKPSVQAKVRAPITDPARLLPENLSFIPLGPSAPKPSAPIVFPAQKNLTTINPKTGRYQTSYNSTIPDSLRPNTPQIERIRPLLIGKALPSSKVQPKSVSRTK